VTNVFEELIAFIFRVSDPADGSNKLLRSIQHYLHTAMAKYPTGL